MYTKGRALILRFGRAVSIFQWFFGMKSLSKIGSLSKKVLIPTLMLRGNSTKSLKFKGWKMSIVVFRFTKRPGAIIQYFFDIVKRFRDGIKRGNNTHFEGDPQFRRASGGYWAADSMVRGVFELIFREIWCVCSALCDARAEKNQPLAFFHFARYVLDKRATRI